MCGLVLRLSDNNPSILKRIRIQRPFSDRACGLLRMYSFYMQGDDECSLSNVAEWENCGKSHTLAPMVTGSAVIGVKYDGGVLIAADTLGSYGSMAKIRNVSRLQCVNDEVAIGFAGDLADAQFVTKIINSIVLDDEVANDGTKMSAKAMFSWVTRVYYNRRSKIDPLWNQVLVAGFDKSTSEPFLGCVNLLGYSWQDSIIGTGMGAHFAMAYMRTQQDAKKGVAFTFEEAQQLIQKSMGILYARDARAWKYYEVVKCDASGVVKSEPQAANVSWKELADYSEGRIH